MRICWIFWGANPPIRNWVFFPSCGRSIVLTNPAAFWLKQLPTEGPQVIQGPGENAGIVDLGDGDAAVFKMESHNHPSYIEPYQGAATGVGGIMRDIFTMGARPVANMNALALWLPHAQKNPSPRRGRGVWHWRLWQLHGCANDWRRNRFRQPLQ